MTLLKNVKTGPETPDKWTLSADPQNITGQALVSGNGKDGVDKVSVFTGDYKLSESVLADYSQDGSWDCGAAPLAGDIVTVGAGKDVTCTITNTRDTAKISLVKQVEGKGDPADWTLTATPNPVIPGQNAVSGNGDPNSPNAVKEEVVYTGTYDLSETGPDKYTAGQWVCLPLTDGNPTVAPSEVADALNSSDSIKLEKGDNIVCTIVNFRNYAGLKLVKQVGGKAQADEFTLTAKAAAPDEDKNISTKGGSGQFDDRLRAAEYTLAETGPGGYSPRDWVCLPAERGDPDHHCGRRSAQQRRQDHAGEGSAG